MTGLKQADLAREANISPSYLNLIEHNRRRIGGKLLLDIAQILEVEPAILTEGAEATLIAGLREAAAHARGNSAEIDRIDEFAGRFPGWAHLLADSHRRIAALEHSVETLSDRLTHDPHLAAALHEMLSTVTAIRSTASILAEPGEIPPDWQRRFHRNIHEDAARLAETSRTLVGYLDAAEDASAEAAAPQEEVDAILGQAGHRFPLVENGAVSPSEMVTRIAGDASGTARQMLLSVLERYAADAAALPLSRLRPALADTGPDPFALAEAVDADPARVMRRLAVMPEDSLPAPLGLVVCDGAGALTYRKPLPDFPLPRFGAGCPLWPLYQSLSHPMVPVARSISQPGRTQRSFTAYAIATAPASLRPGRVPLYVAHMLFVPVPPETEEATDPVAVGVTCRICPRESCPARREPSILGRDGLGRS